VSLASTAHALEAVDTPSRAGRWQWQQLSVARCQCFESPNEERCETGSNTPKSGIGIAPTVPLFRVADRQVLRVGVRGSVHDRSLDDPKVTTGRDFVTGG
jgi:hypothetical protein